MKLNAEIRAMYKKWQEETGKYQSIDIDVVEYSIKRILTDNKADGVCDKRMGFTPETGDGDIPWFTISDFSNNEQLRISNPSTEKKTSMKWVKEKVDKKNTGKSEKLKAIAKGDVLVSFKLSVGIAKIYESDLPAYCNEAIDILTPNESCDSTYLAYNCMVEYPKHATKTNNGYTLNDDSKKNIKVFVPNKYKQITSMDIQKSIVEFIEDFISWRKGIEEKIGQLEGVAKQYENLLLAKVFEGAEAMREH